MRMIAFQKAEALAGQRYDRDKLLAMVHEVTAHFRMPNSFERSRMRAVCRYLVDALDRCNGSTLQQRWNDFEKRFWPKWKAGINRGGGSRPWRRNLLRVFAKSLRPSLGTFAQRSVAFLIDTSTGVRAACKSNCLSEERARNQCTPPEAEAKQKVEFLTPFRSAQAQRTSASIPDFPVKRGTHAHTIENQEFLSECRS